LIARPGDTSYIIRMIFAVQGVLFPLMALFLCLDTVRYREYIPLYLTGKAIGILILFTFSLLLRRATGGMSEVFGFAGEMRLILMDLIAIAAILIIKKDVDKLTESETEDK
jgi:hypothetical protein